MTTTLETLAVLGILGAIDTLYFHEYRSHLPAQHGGIRTELRLHAGRDAVYVLVFGTLPWIIWSGGFALLLILLLLTEIVITMTDFVVEDRVRAPLGGVCPGERVLHGLIAIVYGGMLISFAPVVVRWVHGSSRFEVAAPTTPLWLRLLLTSMAAGIALSGVRDVLASRGLAFASWPWGINEQRVAGAVSGTNHDRMSARRPGGAPINCVRP